jgi:hypothetical protein
MATIRIAIDAFAKDSDEVVVRHELTWTGNEGEARAVIDHVEAATAGHGLKPGNPAHGTLHRLNEILANIGDPSEDDKAALFSYAFRLAVIENPSRGDHGRTVLHGDAPVCTHLGIEVGNHPNLAGGRPAANYILIHYH